MILALEFSSPQRSVAVLRPDAPAAVAEAVETSTGPTMRPLALVDEALRRAGVEREEITRLAVGLGPGSYTGIRAALSLAQGWELARAVTLQGVSTADAVAHGAAAEGMAGRVAVVIDAQRGELYLAEYELADEPRLTLPLRLASRAEVAVRADAGVALVGPEVTKWFPHGRLLAPRAATVARLALRHGDPPPGERLEPIYLRPTTFVKAPPPRPIPPLPAV